MTELACFVGVERLGNLALGSLTCVAIQIIPGL